MKTDYQNINDVRELVAHLLSFSLFYGDYANLFHINNPSSVVSLSIRKNDIAALRKFAARNWIDVEMLDAEQLDQLEEFYEKVNQLLPSEFAATNLNLPEKFMLDLGERALSLGKFRDAYSAFKDVQKLDQRVNQFITEAIQILQKREIVSGEAPNEEIESKCREVARSIYKAVKLKNPFGNQFQKLGQDLHYRNTDAWRKYDNYVEKNLFKEIIEFGIKFLIDDNSIADKIINHLKSGKVRSQILKQLGIIFSGGEEKYKNFVSKYRDAAQLLDTAKTIQDYLTIQKTLLGRGTGDNEYYQFLRELSLEHPISALLVTTKGLQDEIKVIIPRILKSGENLLDYLHLGI